MAKTSKKGKATDDERREPEGDAPRWQELAEAVAALRADVAALKATERPAQKANKPAEPSAVPQSLDEAAASRVSRLGAGFATPVRVQLVHALCTRGALPVATLGEMVGVTTGSLYHNLRELIHDGIAEQTSKTHYSLTDLGRRTAEALFRLGA